MMTFLRGQELDDSFLMRLLNSRLNREVGKIRLVLFVVSVCMLKFCVCANLNVNYAINGIVTIKV